MSTPRPLTQYVLGFLFSPDGQAVVLLRKKHPAWQAGRLNGVGGKIEPGESPLDAMIRKFQQETGVDTNLSGWRHFCRLLSEEVVVHCFAARDKLAFASAKTTKDETVERWLVSQINAADCISNTPWLIALALDDNDGQPFYVTARYGNRPPHRLTGSEHTLLLHAADLLETDASALREGATVNGRWDKGTKPDQDAYSDMIRTAEGLRSMVKDDAPPAAGSATER